MDEYYYTDKIDEAAFLFVKFRSLYKDRTGPKGNMTYCFKRNKALDDAVITYDNAMSNVEPKAFVKAKERLLGKNTILSVVREV